MNLYNNLSTYFREKYGKRLKKICIDGGFSCPNRDGKCGVGGCIYCGERGAGEHIDPSVSIREQVEKTLENGTENDLFVAYFQNFSNTYAPIEVLRERYNAALIDKRIVALAIGTRPDCMNEDIAGLISEYGKEREVWVELGLQTANDKTAEIINRGYKRDVFERAVGILQGYGIKVCVHLIIGLPKEDDEDIRKTAEYLSGYDIWGIKIHGIYVMRGTELEKMYKAGEYEPPTEEEYIRRVIYILTHTPQDRIIHRLTGDCPDDMLVAPIWNRDKQRLISRIQDTMSENGLYQGCEL